MSVGADFDDADDSLVLTAGGMQLRIASSRAELLTLADIATADWDARRSIPVGKTLGHQVFWCLGPEPNEAMVLVGQDDETWEVAVILPLTLVHEIVQIARGPEGAGASQ